MIVAGFVMALRSSKHSTVRKETAWTHESNPSLI